MQNANTMLTCSIHYAYPTAKITWNIMTKSSKVYRQVKNNSTGNYILHNNGSFEVYNRYIYEEDYINVTCSAANKYGTVQSVFNLWDHELFFQG